MKKSEECHGKRAIDDPAALARAARIVRVALERKRPTLAEITPTEQSTTDREPSAGVA